MSACNCAVGGNLRPVARLSVVSVFVLSFVCSVVAMNFGLHIFVCSGC